MVALAAKAMQVPVVYCFVAPNGSYRLTAIDK